MAILVMMSFLSFYLEHLKTANEVNANLRSKEELFTFEARLILDLKCRLLNDEVLENYYLDGYLVDIYQKANTYQVFWQMIGIELIVEDRQIINYELIPFDK